jgi:hypothetical protein
VQRYATNTPPKISLIKCAPIITLVEAIIIATTIKKFLIFGNKKNKQKIKANIVVVCPEGKECHLESKFRISRAFISEPLYKIGRGRPIICLEICATIPLNRIEKNINKLISLIELIILFLLLKILMLPQTSIEGIKKYKESPK